MLGKKNNDENIIVTRRDKVLKKITIKFLEQRKVPYTRIIFIGNKNNSIDRKIKAIVKINPNIYFDNNPKVVEGVKKNGIPAILV